VDHRGLRLSWDADPTEPAYDQALTQQLEELFEALQDGVVVGHHLTFDFGFVAREADRLDIPGPRLWFIDTLALSRRLSVPTPNARLATLLKHFDCLPDRPLHSAPVDARATQALFWKLVAHGQLDTLADAGVKPLTWSTA
jgi:DNA polymerase III alpha subunit (gram-positive type)